MPKKPVLQSFSAVWVVAPLLVVLLLELGLSVRRETQTWDEAAHIYAGYMYWTRGDFSMNPEHPPLIKLWATLPLLGHSLRVPEMRGRYFKEIEFLSGHDFLYANDADWILFRTRMAVALLTLALGLLIFLAGREMFGGGAAMLALVLFVFDPNFLAHGALVTTDAGFSLFLLATIYAFHRYLKRPSLSRLALTGVAAGLGLAAKHSGVLIFPILALLAATEIFRRWRRSDETVALGNTAFRLTGAILVMGLMAFAILWSFYEFRFSARPGGEAIVPSLENIATGLHPAAAGRTLLSAAHWKLLPEAYLIGLADVKIVAENSATYLFGTVYSHGKWFYFPAAFAIKSTLGLIGLLILLPVALKINKSQGGRELAFLVIPPLCYLAVAMSSGLNLGIRHLLPIYPFLFVLAGMAGWTLIQHRRSWGYAVAGLVLFTIVSSIRAFPNYIPYANELWGGPSNTYKLLTDSNVDWAQQLKSTKRYVDKRGVKQCWFAYFADVVAEPAYYGIPCKPLTTIASIWLQPTMDVPPSIDGPVLLSAGVLSGYELGPGELNPYQQFQRLRPSAVIDNGVFVFDGHFDVPLASALNHVTKSQQLADRGLPQEALAELQAAAALAPRSARVQVALGTMLMELHRPAEGRHCLQQALALSQSVEPEYQHARAVAVQETLVRLDR